MCLVISECFLSGRGQGHVSNFHIVDLENFASASRRYTGDIHNTSVVGLFMTPIRQWKLSAPLKLRPYGAIQICLLLLLLLLSRHG